MPDVYATITAADQATQERLAEILEARAGDPRQRAMWESYLSDIAFPPDARVLEVGCGTGAVARVLARRPGVGHVTGVDPSAVFIARARALARGTPRLAFEQGDGRELRFANDAFDVLVAHQTLSHVPQPERFIAEASRVLRPGGWLAIFDGDYATATVAVQEHDPLELCVHAFRASFVHDPWVLRRLPELLSDAGIDVGPIRSHGYIEMPEAGYLFSWIERGAEALLRAGRIGADVASALTAEARRRSEARSWFGHIAFTSVVGRKPA